MLPTGSDLLESTHAARRPRRRLVAITVALATVTALLGFGAPVARAASVPYAVDFDAPAIPIGGVNQAHLDCPNDIGTNVPVTVTDPSSTSTDFVVASAGASSNPPGRVIVDVGPSGLFVADQAGTFTVTVTCSGYDPFTTSFVAMAPSLTMTVAIDSDYDCTTVETGYVVGNRPNLCFTVTNTSGQDIRRFALARPGSTSFKYPGVGAFPAGATQVFLTNGSQDLPFDGATLGGLYVWAELGAQDSGVFAVTKIHSIAVAALPAPLALTTTTGLSSATACADTGGLVDRTVNPGTSVYVCYRVTNTSGVVYTSHGLDDTQLGALLTFFPLDLHPGESYDYVAPAPVSPTAATTYTGTWSSIDNSPYTSLPNGYVATATASATVAASTPATDSTTTTVTTVSPTTTATAQPAVATTAKPGFTG